MYEYLYGKVVDIQPAYVVLDVNGVGYLIRVANPFKFEVGDELTKIYIHQTISDTAQTLYGFSSLKEKQLFEKLLAVSGIGAKSALAILANGDQQAIVEAISQNNVTYLTKFPGIGKKTAQQIVLDLKDKLADFSTNSLFEQPKNVISATDNAALADALEALTALGYKDRDIKRVEKGLKSEPEQSTDAYLSAALKLLTK
ncbi:Holliday junction branch migration protein RuvA [Lactobacillus sp. LC28-10]|uniref:Holliday junction branch migration complex subunit RuvA n=1 Tax=Secundilactobacillus angelensis TaxID=2722706 RepID=A0ABX1KWC8_9LACO|nr:Holliday junction branch migration protein RuvA [Secundilactobacillus angelensis]MCH5462573.1 Holliday junction branch migration protein RuvA [Secundilactobacillus angelensis]NLR18236.1 Holliday junction branch migration protein RuvA [Secundilactobacillus angelensis]